MQYMWWRALSRTSATAAGLSVVRHRALQRRMSCDTCYAAVAAATTATSSVSVRSFTTHVGLRSVHARCSAASSAPLFVSCRTQSSLQKLLDDPSDPYLAALQDFNIPRIAAIVEEGPATTTVPAAFLQRMGLRTDSDAKAAARAQHAASTPLTTRAATSSAEAVLQSLHAAGAERQHEAEAATAAELRSAQAAYDALPEDEKAALQLERVVSHLFDGMCAISAAIRMQAEDQSASPEELDAVFRVCERVVKAYEDGTISPERWAADFASEMAELEVLWHHLGDPRPLPSKRESG
jgi:hypothetical protein